ncbi:MAG: hypothetical protein HYX60_10870, partial [Legionella longbeachae]|nr:hypothetical protein [Legionella longbeachae]
KEKLEQIKPSNYNNMQIRDSKTGYKVINPPFGSNYEVEVLLERPAAKYCSPLQQSVQDHNKKVIDRLQSNSWTQNHSYQLFYHAMKSKHIFSRFEELERNLLNKCRPNFLQGLFETQEHRQKLEAKRIIEQTFAVIKPEFRKESAEKLFLIDPWIKNLEFHLNKLSNANDSFIKGLNQEIKESIEIKLKADLQGEINSKNGEQYLI